MLCLVIGLSDVLAIFKPAWHARLHNVNAFVPGTLTNVTRSADVIIGLMLVLLAHGLRRRKRRAWQAVLALLVFDIVIHFLHFPRRPAALSAAVAIVLLAVLLFFHADFYALGDPRTRGWNALRVFASWSSRTWPSGSATSPWDRWTAAATRSPERVQDVVTSPPASTAAVQWASDPRGDLYHSADQRARPVHARGHLCTCSCGSAQPRARLGAADATADPRVARPAGRQWEFALGYFALRNDKNVIWSPSAKSCVCYRVVSGVMLASGDPIGYGCRRGPSGCDVQARCHAAKSAYCIGSGGNGDPLPVANAS